MNAGSSPQGWKRNRGTLSCCAGLHPDDAGRELTEVVKDLCATKAHLRHWATLSISPMDLEDLLGDIETNNANLHAEGSFSWTNTAATMAYRCRGAGAVHPINGRLRDECLNEHLFLSLASARRIIEAWRTDYNNVRPHSSLGGLAPAEFTNHPRQGHENDEAKLSAA